MSGTLQFARGGTRPAFSCSLGNYLDKHTGTAACTKPYYQRPYLGIFNATGVPCHELTSQDKSTPTRQKGKKERQCEGETRRKKEYPGIPLSSHNLSVL
jgi:hypothetical protein